MNYPKIYKYKDVYVKIDTDISVVIDKLLSVKNDMFREGFTDVIVDDVEHGIVSFRGARDIGIVSFRGARDMTPEESTEYKQSQIS